MPKITINGKELEFVQGQTIIEVATLNGIPIPHFCWHPSLTVSGNCRMCLVDVEKMPKLVIACATLAADGMVVNVETEKAIKARNAVMEFFLINHPLDCPICDEAGECKLQDYTYKYNVGESRFDEEKQHKPKRVPLGPNVMLDAERCIACSRCIRFCDEIAHENQLTFSRRGDRVYITTFPGKEMDNPYSMNTTDICPVGALTNRDFRFKARVWDMSKTNSVCIGCARGCNDEIWVRNNHILRLTPRFNEDVNSYWMCDYGRTETFKFVNKERVDGAHIRKEDNELIRISYEEAFAEISSRLKRFNANEVAVLGSPYATCEDNFVLAKFAKSVFGGRNLAFAKHIDPSFEDDILRKADKTPNSLGAELVGIKPAKEGLNFEGIIDAINHNKIKAVYLIEDDIAGMNTEFENALKKLELLIVHSSNFNKTTEIADIILPASTYAEKNGIVINFQGRAQRLRPAVATIYMDRSADGMAVSRLDKFGTKFDKWAQANKIDAQPTWKMLQSIAALMGVKMKYDVAEDVFEDISKTNPAFDNLDYDTIGETGSLLKLPKSEKTNKPAAV